ncbi:leucine-rich repeat protein [Leifsonia psychrotolerans]|uniref:leucine-rich repeat protein n=1 Tax=Glaciibacter psychrotolerans TaxID=670054 RepID=UPI001C53AD3C|nr:leucine-rich repeat protein [Leifsonia psychrotolerans]
MDTRSAHTIDARRFARRLSLLGGAILVAAGSLTLAAPAHAAPLTHDIDGLTYSVDSANPAAGATVLSFTDSNGQTALAIPALIEAGGQAYPVTTIAEEAFLGSGDGAGLADVTLPDSITTIGALAFAGNDLTTITLPSQLTSIGNDAFANNYLQSVVIPDRVISIDNYAFYQNGMASLDLGRSVTTIGGLAFAGNQLTSLDVPDSVVSIDMAAFAFNELQDVTIGTAIQSIAGSAFTQNFAWDWEPFTDPWLIDFTAQNSTLTNVTFTGAAPADMVFAGTGVNGDFDGSFGPAFNVTVSYPLAFGDAQAAGGYTSPTWFGYPTQALATMTFELNGHGDPIAAQSVIVGGAASAPAAPSALGWTFTGWFADEALTTPFEFTGAIDSDTIVYAGWTKNADVPPATDDETTPGQSGPSAHDVPPTQLARTGVLDQTGLIGASLTMLLIGAGLIVVRRHTGKPRQSVPSA